MKRKEKAREGREGEISAISGHAEEKARKRKDSGKQGKAKQRVVSPKAQKKVLDGPEKFSDKGTSS